DRRNDSGRLVLPGLYSTITKNKQKNRTPPCGCCPAKQTPFMVVVWWWLSWSGDAAVVRVVVAWSGRGGSYGDEGTTAMVVRMAAEVVVWR
nr:hypothetical protein [Tanacetum cinerariifolium]